MYNHWGAGGTMVWTLINQCIQFNVGGLLFDGLD